MPITIPFQPEIRAGSSGLKTAAYCPAPLAFIRSPRKNDTGPAQVPNLLKEALGSWERFKKKYRAELESPEDYPYHT